MVYEDFRDDNLNVILHFERSIPVDELQFIFAGAQVDIERTLKNYGIAQRALCTAQTARPRGSAHLRAGRLDSRQGSGLRI